MRNRFGITNRAKVARVVMAALSALYLVAVTGFQAEAQTSARVSPERVSTLARTLQESTNSGPNLVGRNLYQVTSSGTQISMTISQSQEIPGTFIPPPVDVAAAYYSGLFCDREVLGWLPAGGGSARIVAQDRNGNTVASLLVDRAFCADPRNSSPPKELITRRRGQSTPGGITGFSE